MQEQTIAATPQNQDQPVIRVKNLWTQFGQRVIHQDVSLDVRAGEILSLVGGSGSGKTTLVRQMLGLNRPSRGTVEVFGENIHGGDASRVQQLRQRWGMLFQHGALFSALSAFENVALPMRELRTLPESLIRDAALFKLHLVGISPAEAMTMPANLSGGMVKRVALARALALEPELLFLDEPTAGLDPAMADSFVELIQALHQSMRLTVVMVTHDLDTLYALSTRIAVLADKQVIAAGTREEVMAVKHPFIQEYFWGERSLRALEEVQGKAARP
ncbi:phospholipid/cholesterol/gamma-HCH transport system ATP-binding protein [Paucimonas lemoignei]|uniref:Phospholipid/cholesterol/gamma-HCH transport system ATP-binding protein n=1 Tax=Paucimonas lemoignei TaxID=29443 RepID=A0A4R3I1T9_PAULE|nr:ATP-binding cassette domain-containing protein [Paucimonas lemoignei]TCS37829.1 phospholipid/cholesterol/gamma-HCH transport system ATP-binding protein [Paucimonas lemoignei]